ncbi:MULTISPECIES: hypothetical protein [Pacificimonas]|uniref:hypothetical protein n=1 Tax=Pacificimonas TaxID=1960290 RepID=UPI001CCFC305|nr:MULTISPECIES: hypothetical protein [Pacificimonas]
MQTPDPTRADPNRADPKGAELERALDAGDRQRRHLPRIGLVLSALYVFGLVVYLIVQGQNPADLKLNELGDFLGGVSSPLAFLWLVLGFFQQSREIRLSGQALHLQAREMRRTLDERG